MNSPQNGIPLVLSYSQRPRYGGRREARGVHCQVSGRAVRVAGAAPCLEYAFFLKFETRSKTVTPPYSSRDFLLLSRFETRRTGTPPSKTGISPTIPNSSRSRTFENQYETNENIPATHAADFCWLYSLSGKERPCLGARKRTDIFFFRAEVPRVHTFQEGHVGKQKFGLFWQRDYSQT